MREELLIQEEHETFLVVIFERMTKKLCENLSYLQIEERHKTPLLVYLKAR
jgi:hypothetical protein